MSRHSALLRLSGHMVTEVDTLFRYPISITVLSLLVCPFIELCLFRQLHYSFLSNGIPPHACLSISII